MRRLVLLSIGLLFAVLLDREGLICKIGALAVGAEVVCKKERVAQTGSHTNVGTVYGYALVFQVVAILACSGFDPLVVDPPPF